MLKYLHHASILQCAHGGKIQFIPPVMRSYYVQGSPILTEQDLLKAIIVGCPQVGPGIKPCTKVTQILFGKARKIRVDRETPLLESLQAMTDGNPPGMCLVVSNQTSNAEIGSVSLESDQARTLIAARDSGIPFCEVCEVGAVSEVSEVSEEPTEETKIVHDTDCSLSIHSQTELSVPNDRKRTRIAVCEKVKLTTAGAQGNVRWEVTAGKSKLNSTSGLNITLTAQDLAETATVKVRDDAGCTATISFSVECNYLITKTKLQSIFTAASDARLEEMTNVFNEAYEYFFLNTCLRKAHFFAQVLTEVGVGANPREESMNYTPQGLRKTYKYFRKHSNEANKYGKTTTRRVANQQAIANRAYANRIGNGDIASGDGWRFRGRGYIQLTGRANYNDIQAEINKRFPGSGVDIISNFNDIISTRGGLISAMAFWSRKKLHLVADGGESDADVNNVTRRVNRHTKHPEHRRNHFHNTTKAVFKTAHCPSRP